MNGYILSSILGLSSGFFGHDVGAYGTIVGLLTFGGIIVGVLVLGTVFNLLERKYEI